MGWTILKTGGVKTQGLVFNHLVEQLEQKKSELETNNGARNPGNISDDQKLSDHAELRWTEGKGLYAKNKTWNDGNSFLARRFGSGIFKRGNKYLAARTEIAKSINLAYRYQTVHGQPIGDYIVDKVVSARARQEAIDALNLAGGHYSNEQLGAEVARRQKKICLLFSDLNTLKDELAELVRIGRIRGPLDNVDRNVTFNAVGCVPAGQPQFDDFHGTEILYAALKSDIAAAELRKGAESHCIGVDGREAYSHQLATRILDDMGMRERLLEGGRVRLLQGGLNRATIAKATRALEEYGVTEPEYVRRLSRSINVPKDIVECGSRVMAAGGRLRDATNRAQRKRGAISPSIRNSQQITDDKIDQDLRVMRGRVCTQVEKAERIVRALKAMSLGDALLKGDERREHFNKLFLCIKSIDEELGQLHGTVYEALRERDEFACAAIEDLYRDAQTFCRETIRLLDAIRPDTSNFVIDPQPHIDHQATPPFEITLPGITRIQNRQKTVSRIAAGLGAVLSPPAVLFEKRNSAYASLNQVSHDLNEAIAGILERYTDYLDLVLNTDTETLRRSHRDFMNDFRARVIEALEDNDILLKAMEQRQKIFGAMEDQDVGAELRRAREQRTALLLLLYPRQMQSNDMYNQGMPGFPSETPSSESLRNGDHVIQIKAGSSPSAVNIDLDHVSQFELDVDEDNNSANEVRIKILNGVNSPNNPPVDSSYDPLMDAADKYLDSQDDEDELKRDVYKTKGRSSSDDAIYAQNGRGTAGASRSDDDIYNAELGESDDDSSVDDDTPGQTRGAVDQRPEDNIRSKKTRRSVDSVLDGHFQHYGSPSAPLPPRPQLKQNRVAEPKLRGPEREVVEACRLLESALEETKLLIDPVSKEKFKDNEAVAEGKKLIHISAEEAAAGIQSQLDEVQAHIRQGIGNDLQTENELAADLWKRFNELASVTGRLRDFKSEQERNARAAKGEAAQQATAIRKAENSNAQNVSALIRNARNARSAAQNRQKAAEELADDAQRAMRNIERLAASVCSIAYMIDPRERQEQANGDVERFSDSLVDAFSATRFGTYHFDSSNHPVLHYRNEDYFEPKVRSSVDSYLTTLNEIDVTVKELAAQDGQANDIEAKRVLLKKVDGLLEINGYIIPGFRNLNLQKDILDKGQKEPALYTNIPFQLDQDRENLQKLRMDIMISIQADRQRPQQIPGLP